MSKIKIQRFLWSLSEFTHDWHWPKCSDTNGPKKPKMSIFKYFQIKIFCHFQGKFAIRSRWQMALFNTIFGPLIELKSVIFRKISQPGPGSRQAGILNSKYFSSCISTRTRSSSQIIQELYRGQTARVYGIWIFCSKIWKYVKKMVIN